MNSFLKKISFLAIFICLIWITPALAATKDFVLVNLSFVAGEKNDVTFSLVDIEQKVLEDIKTLFPPSGEYRVSLIKKGTEISGNYFNVDIFEDIEVLTEGGLGQQVIANPSIKQLISVALPIKENIQMDETILKIINTANQKVVLEEKLSNINYDILGKQEFGLEPPQPTFPSFPELKEDNFLLKYKWYLAGGLLVIITILTFFIIRKKKV